MKKKILVNFWILSLLTISSIMIIDFYSYEQLLEEKSKINDFNDNLSNFITYNVMIVGTSHSYGNYLEKSPSLLLDSTYFSHNGKNIKFDVTNLASGGVQADYFLENIAPVHDLSSFDFIIMEYSTCATLFSLEIFTSDMRAIINMVLGNSTIPILQNSVYLDYPDHYSWNRNYWLNPYNDILTSFSENYSIPLVNVNSRFKTEIFANNWDLFIRNDQYDNQTVDYYANSHPNDLGQFYIYQEILKIIIPLIFDRASYEDVVESENSQLQFTEIKPFKYDRIVIENDYSWNDYQEFEWFSGTGSESDPYLIKNVYFTENESDTIIYIKNTTMSFEIRNCTFETLYLKNITAIKLSGIFRANIFENQFYNFRYSLHISNSSNLMINQNKFIKNSEYAAFIQYSEKIHLTSNNFTWNINGARFYFSRNCNISSNYNYNNTLSTFDFVYCKWMDISYNSFINGVYGLNLNEISDVSMNNNFFYLLKSGIVIVNSNSSKISYNIIHSSQYGGIKFWMYKKSCVNNEFFENIIIFSNFGIKVILVPYHNLIYQNYFISNSISIICDEKEIVFSKNNKGNYYSDISVYIDRNHNGINDNVYYIDSSGDCIDKYPLYLSNDKYDSIIDRIFTWESRLQFYDLDLLELSKPSEIRDLWFIFSIQCIFFFIKSDIFEKSIKILKFKKSIYKIT